MHLLHFRFQHAHTTVVLQLIVLQLFHFYLTFFRIFFEILRLIIRRIKSEISPQEAFTHSQIKPSHHDIGTRSQHEHYFPSYIAEPHVILPLSLSAQSEFGIPCPRCQGMPNQSTFARSVRNYLFKGANFTNMSTM